MENLKSREEILSEYFLVESEKTDEIKGWKVLGTIEGCASSSVSPIFELKTDGESWLCDFRVKLLGCGLVLASPEYVIDEDELVMEAMEKVWNAWGSAQQLQEIMSQQIQKKLDEATITDPYYPHDSWTWSHPDSGTWTTTTAPLISTPSWMTNTITCSSANDATVNYATYLPAIDNISSAITGTMATCATTAVNDYATACASATCSC
jgi:hypothetical protein